jgi:23S rRNA pseudouridine2604 synthase
MCEYLGYEVTKLKRTRIMNVELGNLKPGDWRELTTDEMKIINKMISTSSKTEEASVVKEQTKKVAKPKRKNTPQKNDFNKKSASFRKSSPKNKKRSTGFSKKKRR